MILQQLKVSIFLLTPWRYKRKYSCIFYLASGIIYLITVMLLFIIIGRIFFPLPMYRLKPVPSTIVYDRNGKILRAFIAPDEMWRIPADIEDVSPKLRMAIISYEDRWFRYHPGINPFSLARAAITNIRAHRIVCGGSTITMQVARMMEPKPRTIRSKLIEMLRAIQMELAFSKDEILTFYFNMAPYGSNIVGSAAASHFYFNKDQKDLSLGEAALLAAIPNSPAVLRPDSRLWANYDVHPAILARNKVLARLLQNGKINQAQYSEAIAEPVSNQKYPMPFIAPQLAYKLKEMHPGISNILSAVDINIQLLAGETLKKHLQPLRKYGITNGAVVVMGTRTREVLAMVSSADFFDEEASGQVNGAMAPRSPGSALKPFVYALALDSGIVSSETILSDVPVDYSGYRPENYDDKFRGAVTVREALIHSLNVPAINLSAKLKFSSMEQRSIYSFLKEAEINTLTEPEEHYGLSLILGGCEVTLLDLTNLYCGLANMGEFGTYKLALEMADHNVSQKNSIVPPHLDRSISRRLLKEGTAYILTEILSEVERPDLPTCWESAINLPKVAWKTGTSYGHKDAWSIGYSPAYTIGVWVGNFDGAGSPAIVGAEAAAPILFDLFNALSSKEWYTRPDSVKERRVCSLSGMELSPYCRHSKNELYVPGVSPNQQCTMHKAIAIDKETGMRLCSHCRIGRDYETKIFVVWQPEIATWMERNGILVDKLPPHYSECSQVASGDGPVIRSPSAGSEYMIRQGVDIGYQKILLEASISNDSRSIFWFLDSKLIFNGSPTEKVFITPTSGNHKLVCMDDEGRATEMILRIR